MSCDAVIRPFPNDTEIGCEMEGEHKDHRGVIHDMQFPGSKQSLYWNEADRRNFHGQWPGECEKTEGCILPRGHWGNCETDGPMPRVVVMKDEP